MNTSAEQVLHGGNVADVVVRVGSTVRKPAGAATAAVEALLEHLADTGFSGAPRSLGRDELGRHVLEYIPGETAYGLAPLTANELGRLGRLIRELHDATESFEPPPLPPRLRALADGYGLDEQQRGALPALVAAHTRGMYDLLHSSSVTGVQPWARLYAEGHGEHWGPAADYIEAHLEHWAAALLD